MIWATVSSWSCFCWLYRASPSLASKNIINLISVLTIWWCPCEKSSFVLLEEGVCYDQCVLLAKLCQPLLCFILYSKAKLACYSWYLLTTSLDSSLLWWKVHLFLVLVLEGLIGLHKTVQHQLFQCFWPRIGLDYRDIEWFTLETNRDHSVIFEIVLKYCALNSFVDYDGYFISSKGVLLTRYMVDIMVICIRCAYSCSF